MAPIIKYIFSALWRTDGNQKNKPEDNIVLRSSLVGNPPPPTTLTHTHLVRVRERSGFGETSLSDDKLKALVKYTPCCDEKHT